MYVWYEQTISFLRHGCTSHCCTKSADNIHSSQSPTVSCGEVTTLESCELCTGSLTKSIPRTYLVRPVERAGGDRVERDVADEATEALRLGQAGRVEVCVDPAPLQLSGLVHVRLPVAHQE